MKKTKDMEKKTRILLVDEYPMVRRALARLIDLEGDLTVCAEAGTARQALAEVRTAAPDLLVTELELPDMNGIELIRKLKDLRPEVPVLVVSIYGAHHAESALRAGAQGYIAKAEAARKVVPEIRRILKEKQSDGLAVDGTEAKDSADRPGERRVS